MPGRFAGMEVLMADNNHDRFVWTGRGNLPRISQYERLKKAIGAELRVEEKQRVWTRV
jgi:hypothetical protein